jgi:hypothetical protein
MLLLQTTTEINDVEAVAEIDAAKVSSLILWSGDHIAVHLTSMEPDAFPRFQKIAALFNEIARHGAEAEAPPSNSPNPVSAAPETIKDEEPWTR